MQELPKLAGLVRKRNEIDQQIAEVINRPASMGHLGEFIASRIFRIALESSATNKGYDGRFTDGPLAGRTVNVKFYGKLERLLDLNLAAIPDFYLVLTGLVSPAVTSRGGSRPAVIESVFLFEAAPLMEALIARRVKRGVATSVVKSLWDAAEVYPTSRSPDLVVSGEQRGALALFGTALG